MAYTSISLTYLTTDSCHLWAKTVKLRTTSRFLMVKLAKKSRNFSVAKRKTPVRMKSPPLNSVSDSSRCHRSYFHGRRSCYRRQRSPSLLGDVAFRTHRNLLDMMRSAFNAHPYHVLKLILVISVGTYKDCLSASSGWNIFGRMCGMMGAQR